MKKSRLLSLFCCELGKNNTFKLYSEATELQLDALQRLAKRLMVMTNAHFFAGTEGQ